MITCDLNVHIDNPKDSEGNKFLLTLEEHSLSQHVVGATHTKGHSLDVLVTRNTSYVLEGLPTIQDPELCNKNRNATGDHFAVHAGCKASKNRKTVTFRRMKQLYIVKFKSDPDSSSVLFDTNGPLQDLLNSYDHELRVVLNKHAPEETRTIILRPHTPWYTEDLRTGKEEKRRAERQMRKTNLTVHRQMFRDKSTQVTKLLLETKKKYYSNKIYEIGTDQKKLYKFTNLLMGKQNAPIFPSNRCERDLVNTSGDFLSFLDKIITIRNHLSVLNTKTHVDVLIADTKFKGKPLDYFTSVSESEVRKIIMVSPPK